MSSNHPLYLAGRPCITDSAIDVRDKYGGQRIACVSRADPAIVERAIVAATQARPAMAALTATQRSGILEHCAQRFDEEREPLAQLVRAEAGKPIVAARGEVTRLVDTFRIAAREATRMRDEPVDLQTSAHAQGLRGVVRRVPVGVCSLITPFNFPLNLAAHKVAPAIAAGCPFLLKPSERAPLGALAIGRILSETGLPEGAFSVLPCLVEDAAALVEDPRIAMLSFTGGDVGWALRERAGRKRVMLELGGNAACIVDDDPGVDLATLVARLVFGAYYQSGQSCISVQRIIVHEAIAGVLEESLVAAVESLRPGDPAEESTDIGPVIDEAAAGRLEAWIDEAVARGARVLVRGRREGALMFPWLLADVPPHSRLYRDEAFGPVALVETVRNFEQAVERANDSRYGLQAGVFTARAEHVAYAWQRLEVGGVVAGDVPTVRVDSMPYGGIKGSGVGREGPRDVIREMTDPRLLLVRQRE